MRTKQINSNKQKGQSIIEYTILLSVIVAVVVVAISTFVGPAVQGLYQRTSEVINEINPMLINEN